MAHGPSWSPSGPDPGNTRIYRNVATARCQAMPGPRALVCFSAIFAAGSNRIKPSWAGPPSSHDGGRPGHRFRHCWKSRSLLAAGRFFGDSLIVRSGRSELAVPQLCRDPRTVMYASELPMTPQADAVISPFLGLVVPGLVGIFSVLVLFWFKPEAVLNEDQMDRAAAIETKLKEERLGTKKPGPLNRKTRRIIKARQRR
mmetsp:Transcript_38907/g.77213  ORF Transcript_38907/g.77213 Transcript_38907/m.77213 type:complete len:200 (-) Transcript_38907:124-723(-)